MTLLVPSLKCAYMAPRSQDRDKVRRVVKPTKESEVDLYNAGGLALGKGQYQRFRRTKDQPTGQRRSALCSMLWLPRDCTSAEGKES